MIDAKRGAPIQGNRPRQRLSMLRRLGNEVSHDHPLFSVGAAILVLAGPLSLFIAPQPASLVLSYALVGAIAGALCLPREMFPSLIALGVLVLGIDYVTESALRRTPHLQILAFQPVLLVATTWIGADFVPGLLRRASKALRLRH